MSIGGKGTVTVLGNILPKIVHDITHEYINGNIKKSLELQLKYLNFTNSLFIETNPIPIKTVLNLMGKNVGGFRLPLVEMDQNNLNKLKDEMKNIELL